VAIVRNLTLIKCTPGYPMTTLPMPAFWGTSVFGAGLGHRRSTVERKRIVVELTAARVQNLTIDYPSIASAPPYERGT
jgi:hypothetical protein